MHCKLLINLVLKKVEINFVKHTSLNYILLLNCYTVYFGISIRDFHPIKVLKYCLLYLSNLGVVQMNFGFQVFHFECSKRNKTNCMWIWFQIIFTKTVLNWQNITMWWHFNLICCFTLDYQIRIIRIDT